MIRSCGAGCVLDVMASSCVPLRSAPLSMLIAERKKTELLQVYAGNIQWSILATLHQLGGGKCSAPSYSEMWQRVRKESDLTRERSVSRVQEAVNSFFALFPSQEKDDE